MLFRLDGQGTEAKYVPSQGKWNFDNKKVFRSARIKNWLVINLVQSLSAERINNFVKHLVTTAEIMGIEMDKEPLSMNPPSSDRNPPRYYIDISLPPHRNNMTGRAIERRVDKAYKPELYICIFEGRNNVMYSDIKYTFDVEQGITSQCVSSKNVEEMRHSHCKYLLQNLLLKINVKMGGINTVVNEKLDSKEDERIVSVNILKKKKRTMLVGADVTHKISGSFFENEKFLGSVAAVTASMDNRHYYYRTALGLQEREIIRDMKSLMTSLLEQYHSRNDYLPERVIMYRDGVADNTFDQVMEVEVKGMKQAFKDVCRSRRVYVEPKLTMIVVQKRHHTRFCPKNIEQKLGSDLPWERSGNVPSGTLVDQEVVHPTDTDFYLVSHDSPIVSTFLLSIPGQILTNYYSFNRELLLRLIIKSSVMKTSCRLKNSIK
jgi:eukaryotic translation initiation factor 2C